MDSIREEFFPRSDLQKNPGMDSIREEFSPRSDRQKKGSPGGLRQGCFPCTEAHVRPPKKPGENSSGEEFSPPIGSPKKSRGWIPSGRNFSPDRIAKKKEIREVPARGVSSVQRCACPLKKTGGKFLPGGIFSPDRIPKKIPGMDSIREEFFPRSDRQKKEVREVSPRGVSRVQRCVCPLKKTGGKFLPGGIFPPPKKGNMGRPRQGCFPCTATEMSQKKTEDKVLPREISPDQIPKKADVCQVYFTVYSGGNTPKRVCPQKNLKKKFSRVQTSKNEKNQKQKKQQKGKKPKKKWKTQFLKHYTRYYT
jgi:hypothetical protein